MSNVEPTGGKQPPIDDHIQHMLSAIEDGQPDRAYHSPDERMALLAPPTFPEGYDPQRPATSSPNTEMEDGVIIHDHVALKRVWDRASRGSDQPDPTVYRELPTGPVKKLLGRFGLGRPADK